MTIDPRPPARITDDARHFGPPSSPPAAAPALGTDAAGSGRRERRWSGVALTLLIAATAVMATRFHRLGHTTGDDFALYLRQAKSLFEGNVGQVITDNRLLWENSSLVTPQIYPWGWPLLLSPFVRLFGLDYERLKLLEVACLCVWLVLFHGIVRRRAGRIVAFALTAVFATSSVYLAHTDQLITELPHLMVVALVIWWLDRITTDGSLVEATTTRLVVLGLLAVAAYNVRREGIVVLPMIAVAQLVDLAPVWRRLRDRGNDLATAAKQLPWTAVVTPFLTFAGGALVFQLLLPSTLLPDNGNNRKWIGFRLLGLGDASEKRDKSYPRELIMQLGMGRSSGGRDVLMATIGRGLLVAAVVGAVVACVWKPRRFLPLATMTLFTMLLIGTHPRWVGRYYMQVTPYIALFVLMVLYAGYRLIADRRGLITRRHAHALGIVVAIPALWVAAVHLWMQPSRMDSVATRNETIGAQPGPVAAANIPVYGAVLDHTEPDDIVLYYRARTMTLYTGRQSIQTQSVDKAERLGDYFMVNAKSAYSQPKAEDMVPENLIARGWTVVWQNDTWTLWKLPESDGIDAIRTNTVFETPVSPT